MKMKFTKIFFYHGFNSGPSSEKAERLRKAIPEVDVLTPRIDPDPMKAQKTLDEFYEEINSSECNHLPENVTFIHVGTSMGGCWASKMARENGDIGIIINPCYNPKEILPKLGYTGNVSGYEDLKWRHYDHYFISVNDEVLDFKNVDFTGLEDVRFYENTDHRFNGKEFEDVIDFIKNVIRKI